MIKEKINYQTLQDWFIKFTSFPKNKYHPLVWILGSPEIGSNVFIGAMSEVNATNSSIFIGNDCDIASFVSINCADSHEKCLGKSALIKRKKIHIENNVFIGTHCAILGGSFIGHHSVVAAGTIIRDMEIPPYSLVIGSPPLVKHDYYK